MNLRLVLPKKLSLSDIQKIATVLGGACLSKEYIGLNKRLKFRYAKGHEWLATPDNVKNRKTWCPKYARLLTNLRTFP